jgi:Fe-S-cluster containining protein
VEAVRLSSTLQVPLDDVVTRVAGADAHHPWFTVPIPVDGAWVTLALRQTERGECTFLHHVGTRGRCAVHSLRPGICRGYPYAVEEGGERRFVGDQSICPRAWMVDDAAVRRVRADFANWHADLAAERALVKRFSRRAESRRTWDAWVELVGGAHAVTG